MSDMQKRSSSTDHSLFDRVVSILEQARGNAVRAVNTNMVRANWLIGREIVQELQSGEGRAEYGKQVIEDLSAQLTERFGKGFSAQTLWNFRQFYQVYSGRSEILSPLGRELEHPEKLSPTGRVFKAIGMPQPASGELVQGFSPQLSWSHYRALMRVKDEKARDFYERESADCGWSKTQLERQIQTAYYERIIANRGESGLLSRQRERLPGEHVTPTHLIKSPMVLEFLGLPDSPTLHENTLEQAIIENLQAFLLELGKGFSFVARQKHIRFDDEDFYIDLVFYNYILKCFLLIDLKIGKLTHRDVGQMDGYVRLYEDQFKVPGDNPTIGLILCSDKSEAVAKYSVLNEGKQIFASKYLQVLPTEEQLKLEIERERKLIEAALAERKEIESGK
ncbi:MAG: PDDEXK nuclease domain-containing protein [Acidobacteriota bacterium]|nr:PDDEXK nuclease domain-containing protein [Acidobacteriota bacterium]